MNKKLIVRMIVGAVMMGSSAASMAATNQVGTHTSVLNGSFVGATCSVVEWPQDVNFDPINIADWGNFAIQQGVQIQSHGKFQLEGCPADTPMKYTVTAPNLAQGNQYQALALANDGGLLQGFGIRFSASGDFSGPVWKLDGTEANLGRTNAQGELEVPAFAQIVKRSPNLSKAGQPWDGGNFSTNVTYTISYD